MIVNSKITYVNTNHFDTEDCIKVDNKYSAVFDYTYYKLFYNEWRRLCMDLYAHVFYAYKQSIDTDHIKQVLINDNGLHKNTILVISHKFNQLKPILLINDI